jgi:DNA-binding transcriptional LysR family regulator
MDLNRLRTFVVAAKRRSFTQAGRELSFSQSAVSQQMRELEDQIGARLFERSHRIVTLTPAGDDLLPLAIALLRDADQATVALAKYRGAVHGVLHVGASNTLGIYVLPLVLGRFSQALPHVRPTLRVSGEAEILRAVQDGDLDIAVLSAKPPAGQVFGWDIEALVEDDLVLIAAPEHPWAKRESIALSELPTGVFILRQSNSPTRHLIQDSLASAGINPGALNVRFELGNTEGLKRAVMAGLGVGWVPSYAIREEQAHGTLVVVAVEGLLVRRSLWLLRSQRASDDLGATTFCDILRSRAWEVVHLPV